MAMATHEGPWAAGAAGTVHGHAASHDQLGELMAVACRPMNAGGRRFGLAFWALGLVVLWGAAAYAYQLARGLSVTGYTQQVPWGVYEANIVSFIGLSYGGALVSAILRLAGVPWRAPIARIAEAVALVTLLVGSAFPVIHLGRPERSWELLVRPRGSSPLVWDLVAIGTYLVATVVFFYLPALPDVAWASRWPGLRVGPWRRRLLGWLARRWAGGDSQEQALERALAVMSVLIIPLAVSVHSVLAWAFAVTPRPGWHSTIYAPYFVVAALYSGVALVVVAVAVLRRAFGLERYLEDGHLVRLGYLLLVSGATYLYFTFAELLTEGYVADRHLLPVLEGLLTGPYAGPFWTFVLAGLVAPVLLVALPWTRTASGVTAAACLAVGAMWLKRFLVVVPPLSYPVVGEGFSPYRPSWVEVSVTAGAAAAVAWLLLLVFRLVPVLPVWEMARAGPGRPGGHGQGS